MSDPKNPTFIPSRESTRRRGCPKCGHEDFDGRRIQGGSVVFTCQNKECRNKWSGGLPQAPAGPLDPVLPENPRQRPHVSFDPFIDPKTKELQFREESRAPDQSQVFRRGALIPDDEES